MSRSTRRPKTRPRRSVRGRQKTGRAERRAPKRRASSAGSSRRAKAASSVAEIVATLHAHRQRATYGAVGGLRGAPAVRARGWFAGREGPENSFVVSRLSGEPIGYPPDRVHPALRERPEVLESPDALREWLEKNPMPR